MINEYIYNPLKHFRNKNLYSRIVCQSLAYMEQFTFVSAMAWQTQIGQNNIQTLRGSLELRSHGLSLQHGLVGYGLPALLSVSTAIVEVFGQKCAAYKPRFGDRCDGEQIYRE